MREYQDIQDTLKRHMQKEGELMTRIDVRDLKGKIKDNAVQVTLEVIGKRHQIMLAYQNNGFGKKRFLYVRIVQRMFSICILPGTA